MSIKIEKVEAYKSECGALFATEAEALRGAIYNRVSNEFAGLTAECRHAILSNLGKLAEMLRDYPLEAAK